MVIFMGSFVAKSADKGESEIAWEGSSKEISARPPCCDGRNPVATACWIQQG